MYRWGHVGASLFCYAPVGALLTRAGDPHLALLGSIVAVGLSTLPDVDEFERVPVDHRGPTHTVWFVAVVSLLVAVAGFLAGVAGLLATTAGTLLSVSGLPPGLALGSPVSVAVTVGTAAFVSLGSHLLADSLTPMGVRPFAPLSAVHYSFGLTPAKDPRANAAMLGVGSGVAVACQLLAML